MFIPILLNGVLEDHYFSYSLIPVYENGKITGVYDAFRNMTETVIGARRLRESETRLKLATEVAKLGVFVWDTAEDSGSWENDHMYEIFGRTRDEGPVNGSRLHQRGRASRLSRRIPAGDGRHPAKGRAVPL